jgi:hypothetical protein
VFNVTSTLIFFVIPANIATLYGFVAVEFHDMPAGGVNRVMPLGNDDAVNCITFDVAYAPPCIITKPYPVSLSTINLQPLEV